MKKIKIAYWIVTVLFSAFMIFSAYPDMVNNTDAIKIMETGLGYPHYLAPFLGWAKLIGAIVILIPGFPRIKEWAYAGLMFDLIGATYSIICVGGPGMGQGVTFMLIIIAVGFTSYALYHKKNKAALNA